MSSIEMNDGMDITAYHRQRATFVEGLKNLIASKPEWAKTYKVDVTTIAVDIENPHAGKALGANRALQVIREKGLRVSSASFVTFGDSVSDVEMAKELERRGLGGTFVYVGPDTQSIPDDRSFHVESHPGYDKGTISYFRSLKP